MEKKYCECCEQNASETWECSNCGQMIGECCQANYTYYTPIDYNCCKYCAGTSEDN